MRITYDIQYADPARPGEREESFVEPSREQFLDRIDELISDDEVSGVQITITKHE
jgi:hypothetical protein